MYAYVGNHCWCDFLEAMSHTYRSSATSKRTRHYLKMVKVQDKRTRNIFQFIYATWHEASDMTYVITHHIAFCIWH
jgi:hypothetical protein